MVAKTAWQGVRLGTLLGGLLLLPAVAMFGPGRKPGWPSWIWEAAWGVKLASAREPFVLDPEHTGPSSLSVKIQLFNQNSLVFSQNPSSRGLLEPPSPRPFLGSPSPLGNVVPTATQDRREFPRLDPEESGLGGWGPWEASSRNPANRRGPGMRGPIPEPSPLFGGIDCQTVSSGTTAFPSELLGCQKDCPRLGRYLEQLGVCEYSVHRWNTPEGGYRAWCRVKVLPNGSLWTRHLEARGWTAAEAMAKVVEQVVQWRERNMGGLYSP